MKRSTEPKICTEQVEQCTPELAGQSWISVRYDYLRETMQSENVVNEDLGIFHGCDLLFISSEMHHFG